jgi:hypothetical protein
VAETIWEVDDPGESEFCPCGVTLMGDPGDDGGLCSVCATAPHGRDCGCGECAAYWHRVAAESKQAAEAFNRRFVCSCGWAGAWPENHDFTRESDCEWTEKPKWLRRRSSGPRRRGTR